MEPEEIKKLLKKRLDYDRYQHTLGVADTAACLAMRYGQNMEQAYMAGLLHDCAKCVDNEKKIRLLAKHCIMISNAERENPELVHAKVGSILAQEKYGIDDPEILSAIKWHTTGHPGMTELEKIIFVADYIEPSRKKAPDLTEVRKTCFENLDNGVRRILADTLRFLSERKGYIDQTTQETYDFYLSEVKSFGNDI